MSCTLSVRYLASFVRFCLLVGLALHVVKFLANLRWHFSRLFSFAQSSTFTNFPDLNLSKCTKYFNGANTVPDRIPYLDYKAATPNIGLVLRHLVN